MQRPFYYCWGSGKTPPCSVCGIKAWDQRNNLRDFIFKHII